MNMLPPKKRKENRQSQEDHNSSDETSSYTSESSPNQEESVSPGSTSPLRQSSPPTSFMSVSSFIPMPAAIPIRSLGPPSPDSIAESPPLIAKIKDEPDEILEVDDTNRSSEADSGVEDIKAEDDRSGHSDEDNSGIRFTNVDRKVADHTSAQAMAMQMMALQHQARVCRPIANRVGVGVLPFSAFFLHPPFFPNPLGLSTTYPRVFLPPALAPISPPPANRSYSPRIQKSPHRGSTSIQDGNSPSQRLTRLHEPYFESQTDLGKRQKDERLAEQLGISRADVEEVVHMPMDEFQDYAHKKSLTEDQMNILRDIRRRGKNKKAAQNCRKRKIDQIESLQEQVEEMKMKIKKGEESLKENLMMFEDYSGRLKNIDEEMKTYDYHLVCGNHIVWNPQECNGRSTCDLSLKLFR